ncbi:MAG: hypothetical protein WC822_03930 [Candidatus Paceibacterota bacterium]|jgi:hypothetical protein
MEYKSENKVCQNCKKKFVIEKDDFSFYEKIKVPPPTFCPSCRSQRRLAWRNDIFLYNRMCDLCKKSVVTIYSKESNIIVYCNKCWWGDTWDVFKYGKDYDFSRAFFEQFKEFLLKIPHLALVNDNNIASVNCEYTQDFAFSKNCYMVFIGWKIENVIYSYYIIAGKDMIDCMNVMVNSQWLYECIQPEECYRVKYSQFTVSCMDSQFIYDCRNCTNCFLCSGLRNAKYYFKNKQYSKEEYEKILSNYNLDTFLGAERAQKEFDDFILNTPRRCNNVIHSLNSSGDLLKNAKNSFFCFNVQNPENCKWIDNADTPHDSYDLATGGELSECYEGITCDHSSRNLFGIFSWKNQDVEYTHHCHSSKSLFGCVGIRNKKYCIFNKQYTKEEYEKLVLKIKQQMNDIPYIDKKGIVYKYGEFYPMELSYFGYNETVAGERFSLEKEEATSQNLNWQDNIQRTTGKETLKPENIPESINDVEDSIVDEVLVCINCQRNYKIIENELIFYRKMKIPVPRRCFYCRHTNRMKRRNPFKLWHRKCMKEGCQNEFETSYAPERPEIVYCESCYQQEVY